jgi:hypothetical protein
VGACPSDHFRSGKGRNGKRWAGTELRPCGEGFRSRTNGVLHSAIERPARPLESAAAAPPAKNPGRDISGVGRTGALGGNDPAFPATGVIGGIRQYPRRGAGSAGSRAIEFPVERCLRYTETKAGRNPVGRGRGPYIQSGCCRPGSLPAVRLRPARTGLIPGLPKKESGGTGVRTLHQDDFTRL